MRKNKGVLAWGPREESIGRGRMAQHINCCSTVGSLTCTMQLLLSPVGSSGPPSLEDTACYYGIYFLNCYDASLGDSEIRLLI